MQLFPAFVFSAALAASTAIGITTLRQPLPDRCALPSGITSTDPQVALRAMACRDVEAGRISMREYRTIAGLDVTTTTTTTAISMPLQQAVEPQWASSVRDVSSEWSAQAWNAQNVLGAPNVYPKHGDIAQAWASREQDARTEFIEVGFANPTRAAALQIVETFNPGAIEAVELVTTSGRHLTLELPDMPATGQSRISTISTACTDEPIAAARVTLNSAKVPGWNEIDAIGLVSCR